MNAIRKFIQEKPWIGWAVAGVLAVGALWLAFRGQGGDAYSTDRMTEMVTIRFADTGETIQMPRGRLIRDLMLQPGKLDASKGIINPKTKEPTGFIFDEADWKATVERINADKDRFKPDGGGNPSGNGK